MGEIKSVKVDNWGVFFLQKLQNFFNKTDYCDLTLQFRDNSQLKVHRLVLSACTDYFNVLEQTCEVVDDAIIMPNGLQADVVVPIVNFMYTGTLEFELKMYNRLLRTAKDMNMTVLLKLLEAHRRTMEMHPQKNQAPTSPKARRKITAPNTTSIPINVGGRSLIQPQNKRIVVSGNVPQQQHRIAQPNAYTRLTSSSATGTTSLPVKQQIGSTTFTRIKQESDQDANFGGGGGGYTLLKKSPQQSTPNSPFEQLRKAYTSNNKRPAAATFISPPAKKPNLEDVKEFAEQQRMRKQIAAEYGDDGDYDTGIMDDDTIHNDDDDDDMTTSMSTTTQPPGTVTSSSAAAQTSSTQQQTEDPPGTTTIIVKHEGPDKPPTIVVKDSSNSKMNHAKIISEVLRQYPHLVNSNKNIKLKIMPNTGGQTQKVIVKKESVESEKSSTTTSNMAAPKLPTLPKVETKASPNVTTVANRAKQQIGQPANTNATIGEAPVSKDQVTTVPAAAIQPQKRRIDSKTMHALIALGAENTTGPWLCLRCGRNGHPISIPSYRGFRRHLINTHKETIDPALCEHCGWRSSGKRELHFHMQLEHKVRTNLYIFPECQLCRQMCIDSDALNQHLIDSHPDENKQQCIYCNKIFPEELQLYTHMKTFHKKQALEDGIIDYSDDENTNTTPPVFPPSDMEELLSEEHEVQQQPEKKIKILSDISLPIASSIIKTDSFVAESVTARESSSAASDEYLHDQEHVETKFVAADGSEVILTDEQRKEILSQLNQENEGSGVVMVLNENQQFAGGETQSEQGAISHDETSQATTVTNDDQEQDDNQIYNEIKSGAVEEDTASQPEPDAMDHDQQDEEHIQDEREEKIHQENLDESKESMDNLEWAENLISEHDMADEVSPTPVEGRAIGQNNKVVEEETKGEEKSQDDISKKLRELAGEWSEEDDDDDVEEEMHEEIEKPKPGENVETVEKEHSQVDDIEITTAETEKIIDEIVDKPEDQTSPTKEEVDPPMQEEAKQDEKEVKEEVGKPLIEDDVDLALESLHKEVDDDKEEKHEAIDVSESAKTKDVEPVKENIKELETEEIVKEKDETISEEQKDENKVEEDSADKLAEEEGTKKDLIDMLISEQADAINEDTTAQDKDVASNVDTKEEEKSADNTRENVGNPGNDEPAIEDEFLDVTPEKVTAVKEEDITTTASSTGKEAISSSTTSVKETISSEEHVKSLISEWGDDEDEDGEGDENEADLTANL